MSNTLGTYMFLRNGDFYDYPWRESLLSVMPIAEQIVVCECYSDKDNTWEELQKFAAQYPKVKLVQREWIAHHSGLSQMANYCIPFLSTDWKWQIQADEVIHENNYDVIKKALEGAPDKVNALKTNYTHFLGSYSKVFPFCYQNIIRIARKGSGWWLAGDACQLDKPGYDPCEVKDTEIMVYHYGKVHSSEKGFLKEWDFQQLYVDLGFPDPKMREMSEKLGGDYCDYLYLFESNIREGRVKDFVGTHPAVMHQRIQKFKDSGWEQFDSKMIEGLKI